MSERFDQVRLRRWRKEMFRELRKMGCLPHSVDHFAPAMVLISIAQFGTDMAVLVELTGYPPALILRIVRRLRRERIVVGQSLRVHWNEDCGVIAFCCDALVAAGIVKRPADPKRSQAAKARLKPQVVKERRRRAVVAPGAVFTPMIVNSNPLYAIEESFRQACHAAIEQDEKRRGISPDR